MSNSSLFRLFSLLLCVIFVICLLPVPQAYAASQEDAVNAEIKQIVAAIPASADTDAEKALYLHDYVVEHVAYVISENDQTAYGALIEGRAVCTGYAEAYQLLLAAVGIESSILTGYTIDATGYQEAHAWNMVWLGGKCYFTDVTWDDPFVDGVQQLRHTYFNMSLEQLSADHFPDEESMALLPGACNHTDLDYFSLRCGEGSGVGIFTDSTTASQAARYFMISSQENGVTTYTCSFRFDGKNSYDWIVANWADIAIALNYTGSVSCNMEMYSNSCRLDLIGTIEEATVEPAPTETEPAPTETEPAPTETEPAPTETEPAPTETEPAPTETEPAPTETEPAPTETEPAPTETEPVPTEADPAPTETEPAPTEAEPIPTETVPASAETDPVSTETVPVQTEPSDNEEDDGIQIIILAIAVVIIAAGITCIVLLTRKKK